MMKPVSWLSLLLILVFILTGCTPVGPTLQPTQQVQLPSPINPMVTVTVAPTSPPTPAVTDTPSPTATQTPLATLRPESIKETIEPLLQDPMNCDVPCFWGITPGKTSMDEVRNFFSRLGFTPFEGNDPNSGIDFYTIEYKSGSDPDYSAVTLYLSNNLVENIKVNPSIYKQKEGRPREWIVYSPETLIKKFGNPSRVNFNLDWPGGGGSVIIMNMYFDTSNLIVSYIGENMLPSSNHSPKLCPLTAPFDYVRLWLGAQPSYPPLKGVLLEKATSLTIDQFTQLLLGDPQHACFTINGDAFQ